VTEIPLKRRTLTEIVENLILDVSLLKVQMKLLEKELEELKNDNGK